MVQVNLHQNETNNPSIRFNLTILRGFTLPFPVFRENQLTKAFTDSFMAKEPPVTVEPRYKNPRYKIKNLYIGPSDPSTISSIRLTDSNTISSPTLWF